MNKTIAGLCLILAFSGLSCAEHLVYGQAQVSGDTTAADGARVTLTNQRSGDACRATVGKDESGWWSADVDKCMDWQDGDGVALYAKKGSLEAEDSMTLHYGGSQQAPSLALEEPDESDEESSKTKIRLSFLVYPAGSRFGAEAGPYCEYNPLTLRFEKEHGWAVKEVQVHVTRGKETVFSFNTGEKTYAELLFNETGVYRIQMSSPYVPESEIGDMEIVDCGLRELCSNGVKDYLEYGVDCGGRCPACPTCRDGVQNKGEDGIDCGGPCDTPCEGNETRQNATTTAAATSSTTTSSSTTSSTSSTTTIILVSQEPVEPTTTSVPENNSITGMAVNIPRDNETVSKAVLFGAIIRPEHYKYLGFLSFMTLVIGSLLYFRKPIKVVVVKPQPASVKANSAVATRDFIQLLDADDVRYLKTRFGWVMVTPATYTSYQNSVEDIFTPEDPKPNGISDKNLALAKERKAILLTEDPALREQARKIGLATLDYLGLAAQRG